MLIINDLKDMLNKTNELYGDRPAYRIKLENNEYKTYTHKEFRNMVDCLGTSLINLGLKGKRIAVIGENRFEWGLAYLSIVCGTGIVVPLDKSLPENELSHLIARSEVEAIFFAPKYAEAIQRIKAKGNNNLKFLFSMDSNIQGKDIYTQEELLIRGKTLILSGNRDFIDAKINPIEMSIMLFTSGTTSEPKVVALSHKNICTNIMDISAVLNINEYDRALSFLPLHHVFECTAGFLHSLYAGCQVTFCKSIRNVLEDLNDNKITFACFVPAIYENFHKNIIKKLEEEDKLEEVRQLEIKYKEASIEEKRQIFKNIHDFFGGEIKLFVTGAAAIDVNVVKDFRNWGINICQGYGLTETSPVVAIENETINRVGSIGKALPSVQVKLNDVDENGMGELMVKGNSVMLGYYNNQEATDEVLKNNWFYTGDLAKIDEEGYIYICGRKKSVIVLKNGKNIFPEEMEILINRIAGVKESFIFGRKQSEDKENVKINVKIVFDRKTMERIYSVKNDEEIFKIFADKIKEINRSMPRYKAIKGIILTEEPLIRTTTNKIKRQENLKMVEKETN